MSAYAKSEFDATGVAQVIVIHRASGAAAATDDATAIEPRFTHSEFSLASALAATAKGKHKEPPAVRHYPNLGVSLGTVDKEGLAALRKDKQHVANVVGAPQLTFIRPERVAAAKMTVKRTWGIEALGIPALWEEGLTGKDVLIGHMDTGVDGSHPALKSAVAKFTVFDSLGNKIKNDPKVGFDSDEHGTHTAATIAGRAVSGKHFGVAPGAKLASAVVIEGGNVVARILGGLDWAVGHGVRVVNVSLGLRGWWNDFIPIIQILRSKNVLPVVAVGNEGTGKSRSPGNYAESLSVGAVDESLDVADFSCSQRFARPNDPLVPDVVAPGVGVISAKPGGGVQLMDGSSMATPHISGLAALLIEAKPTATVDQIENAILQSCKRKSGVSEERANRGVPNAAKALELLV